MYELSESVLTSGSAIKMRLYFLLLPFLGPQNHREFQAGKYLGGIYKAFKGEAAVLLEQLGILRVIFQIECHLHSTISLGLSHVVKGFYSFLENLL